MAKIYTEEIVAKMAGAGKDTKKQWTADSVAARAEAARPAKAGTASAAPAPARAERGQAAQPNAAEASAERTFYQPPVYGKTGAAATAPVQAEQPAPTTPEVQQQSWADRAAQTAENSSRRMADVLAQNPLVRNGGKWGTPAPATAAAKAEAEQAEELMRRLSMSGQATNAAGDYTPEYRQALETAQGYKDSLKGGLRWKAEQEAARPTVGENLRNSMDTLRADLAAAQRADGQSWAEKAQETAAKNAMAEAERVKNLPTYTANTADITRRAGQNLTGLGQQALGSFMTLGETIDASALSEEYKEARERARELVERQQAQVYLPGYGWAYTPEYQQALDDMAAHANDTKTLTPENSPGMRMYQQGGEKVAASLEGVEGAPRVAAEVADAVIGNLPALAVAALPVPGAPALSLALMGTQAAGGKAAELQSRGVDAREALDRGIIAGGIEILTESIPVGNWTKILKGNGGSILRNILTQMGEEGTEEAVSYIADYVADLAYKDPEASFSLSDLLKAAGLGAASGGIYGAAGTGINAAVNGVQNYQAAVQTREAQAETTRNRERLAQAAGVDAASLPTTQGEMADFMRSVSPEGWAAALGVTQEELPNSRETMQGFIESVMRGMPESEAAEAVEAAGQQNRQTIAVEDAVQAGTLSREQADNKIAPPQEAEGQENVADIAQETEVNDNPKTHTPEQMASIQEYKDAVDPGMVQFVENVKNGNYSGPYLVTEVTPKVKSAMLELTGMDRVGSKIMLDANGVTHILKRHGENGVADRTMASVADIARAAYVINNYDNAYLAKDRAQGYSMRNSKTAPIVIFEKKIDGAHIVVEAVTDTKRDRNFIVTEYTSKNGVPKEKVVKSLQPSMGADASIDSRDTAEPLNAGFTTTERIPSPAENVNPENSASVSEEGKAARPAQEQTQAPAASETVSDTSDTGRDTTPGEEAAPEASRYEKIDGQTTTAKSREYQSRKENYFAQAIGGALDVPRGRSREYLRPIVHEMMQEVKATGSISKETADRLFETAWSQGIVEQESWLKDYEGLKEQLRNTVIAVDSQTFQYARTKELQREMGRRRMVKFAEDGVPLDVVYKELSEDYPELFSPKITDGEEQLRRIKEIAGSFDTTRQNLDAYYGDSAEDFKMFARQSFDEKLDGLVAEAKRIARMEKDTFDSKQSKEATAQKAMEMTEEEITAAHREADRYNREAERMAAKAMLTSGDRATIDSLLEGRMGIDDIPLDNPNREDIINIYLRKKKAKDALAPVIERRKAIKTNRLEQAAADLEGSELWKDKGQNLGGSGLVYKVTTLERNLRDMVKGKGPEAVNAAEKIVEKYAAPVHAHEAEKTRAMNAVKDRVRELGLNQWESEYLQIYGEMMGFEAAKEQGLDRLDAEKDALQVARDKLMEEHGEEIDLTKVQEQAYPVFREIYGDLFKKVNAAYIRNGYEPMKYREGYFPHFSDNKGDTVLERVLHDFGVGTFADNLPTSIAGLTDTFTPGRNYNQFANQRTGYNTEYDAIEGLNRYLNTVGNVIYHIDDIQNLRALEAGIRYRYSTEGQKEKIKEIWNDEALTDDERRQRIADIHGEGQSHLSTFVQYLHEYTNDLAGKKLQSDRAIESDWGRGIYRTVNSLEGRIQGAQIAFNIGSALTNFIPLAQATAEISPANILKAAYQVVNGEVKSDGFAQRSDFLTNRAGVDELAAVPTGKKEKTLDTVKRIANKPFELVDGFASQTIARARYLQAIADGMDSQQAMRTADEYTGQLMADRSFGALPLVFRDRNPITKLFTMYQVEVKNQLDYLAKDLPRNLKNKYPKEEVAAKMALAMLRYTIFSYLFNDLYELIVGRRPAFDPLSIGNEAFGELTGVKLPNTWEEISKAITGNASGEDFTTERKGLGTTLVDTAGNVAEEMPFVGGLLGGGRIPISGSLPKMEDVSSLVENTGNGNFAAAGKDAAKIGSTLALGFIPGGGQIKKTTQGVGTWAAGEYRTGSGDKERVRTDLDRSLTSLAQAAMFGRSAIPEVREYYASGSDGLTASATKTWDASIKGSGIDFDVFDKLMDYNGKAKADKDSDGKTIAGSKKDKVLAEIDRIAEENGYSDEQKKLLIEACGYKVKE